MNMEARPDSRGSSLFSDETERMGLDDFLRPNVVVVQPDGYVLEMNWPVPMEGESDEEDDDDVNLSDDYDDDDAEEVVMPDSSTDWVADYEDPEDPGGPCDSTSWWVRQDDTA